MRVYYVVLFFFLFPRGDRIGPIVLECRERLIQTEIKSSSALFLVIKNWKVPRPPPTLSFLPKSTDQNFEIAILSSIVENHNNYVFEDGLLPQSPRGRGCKLHTLTSVYV